MKEKVLVVDKETLDPLPGLDRSQEKLSFFFKHCLSKGWFAPRGEAETDESILQIIPYVVFIDKGFALTYCRSKESGEDRLHDKYSIGIGGHVNTDDLLATVTNPRSFITGYRSCQELALLHAVRREIQEELDIFDGDDFTVQAKPKMMIYDNRDAVGRVHLGLVMFAQADEEHIKPKGSEISKLSWENHLKLRELGDKLEGWSQYLIEHLED